jgi:hypothetical protein
MNGVSPFIGDSKGIRLSSPRILEKLAKRNRDMKKATNNVSMPGFSGESDEVLK